MSSTIFIHANRKLTFLSLTSLSKTIDAQVEGEMATLKETVNDMVFKLRTFSSEVTRVSLEVGTKGQLGGQAVVLGVEGTWKELVRVPPCVTWALADAGLRRPTTSTGFACMKPVYL